MTTNVQDSRTINGFDTAALQQSIAHIEANSDAAQTNWRVTSRWQGGAQSDHFVEGFGIGGESVDRSF